MRGRLGPLAYTVRALVALAPIVLFVGADPHLVPYLTLGQRQGLWPFGVVFALSALTTLNIRRLHDFGLSGWWLIPVGGAYFALALLGSLSPGRGGAEFIGLMCWGMIAWLCFWPSQKSDNRHGPGRRGAMPRVGAAEDHGGAGARLRSAVE